MCRGWLSCGAGRLWLWAEGCAIRHRELPCPQQGLTCPPSHTDASQNILRHESFPVSDTLLWTCSVSKNSCHQKFMSKKEMRGPLSINKRRGHGEFPHVFPWIIGGCSLLFILNSQSHHYDCGRIISHSALAKVLGRCRLPNSLTLFSLNMYFPLCIT